MAKQWRAQWNCNRSGYLVQTGFHVKSVGVGLDAGNDPSAETICTTLDAALRTKFKAVITTDTTLESFEVRQEVASPGVDIPEVYSLAVNQAGTRSASGAYLPNALCAVAKITSNAAVRSGYGRMFLPPALTNTALSTGQQWDATSPYWLACVALMAEIIAGHHTGDVGAGFDIDPIVYSRTRRARGDSNYWFDVTGYVLRSKPHYLRSRDTAP